MLEKVWEGGWVGESYVIPMVTNLLTSDLLGDTGILEDPESLLDFTAVLPSIFQAWFSCCFLL
jgi:hypothetical protein